MKKQDSDEQVKITSATENLVSELLGLLGVTAKVEISCEKAKEDEPYSVVVNLDSEEFKGVLIGRHGENIQALQTFVAMSLKNRLGEWVRVLVNVGDWNKKQEEQLVTLATQTAIRAKETGQPQPLYNLTPAQRRIVHLALVEDKSVETESLGEGLERYLVVKPRQ